MAGARGDTYVMNNLGRYEGLIQDSLTLRPLTATDGSLTDYDATRYVLLCRIFPHRPYGRLFSNNMSIAAPLIYAIVGRISRKFS